jgi:hypothetical protein
MAGVVQGDESEFAPSVCEFWQANRIPHSPLYPRTQFLRWLLTDSEENYRKQGNKAFSVESVGYEFNSLGYREPEFNREPGEAVVMFLGDSHTFGLGMPWESLWTSLVRDRLLRLGIPYYWGNLEQFSREMLGPYLPLDGFAGCWQKMDLARDGIHGGLKSHSSFAASVISTMERGALSRPSANRLSAAQAARAVAVPSGAISQQKSALDRINVLVPQSIRELIGNLRVRRRVRAMKRKDPFIY